MTYKNKTWHDDSVAGFVNGKYTTQGFPLVNLHIGSNEISFTYSFNKRVEMKNSLLKSIILRLVAISVYQIPLLQRVLKKLLVTIIMKPKNPKTSNIHALIKVNTANYDICIENPDSWKQLKAGYHNHMASANTLDLRHIT